MKTQPALFSMPAPRIPHPCGGWLPGWLCEEIHASGGPAYRATAVWTRCPGCGEIILTGLDDPVIGIKAAVDPTPLDPWTLLAATLDRRAAYRVRLLGTGARITARDQWSLQRPAEGPGLPPLVPAHKCGARRFPGFIVDPDPERNHRHDPPF